MAAPSVRPPPQRTIRATGASPVALQQLTVAGRDSARRRWAIVIKTTRMAFHGSRPAHRSHPPRGEARARQDNRPHAVGAQRRRGHLHLDATPRTGHDDAAGQPAARWLCLRTPPPGTYCTKTVMGRSILLTRGAESGVRQRLPAPPVTHRRRLRGRTPARMSVSLVDLRPQRQPRRRTRQGGLPRNTLGPCEADRVACRRMCRLPVDFAGPGRDARHPGVSRAAQPTNWSRGASAGGRRWVRRCSTARSTGSSRSTRSPRTTIRDGAQEDVRDHRAQQLHVFDSFGPHHRLVFPSTEFSISRHSRGAVGSAATWWSSTRCSRTSCCRARSPTGELFRVYPTDVPGRSITVHQNSTPLDLSDESAAAARRRSSTTRTRTVRDEDYALVAGLQANLESGARERLVFGRNEPGQHRHQTWQEAISRRT